MNDPLRDWPGFPIGKIILNKEGKKEFPEGLPKAWQTTKQKSKDIQGNAGIVPGKGRLVIDIDSCKRSEEAKACVYKLPPTTIQKTQSGMIQAFYYCPDAPEGNAIVLSHGAGELRKGSAFVIRPGSKTEQGTSWELTNSLEPATVKWKQVTEAFAPFLQKEENNTEGVAKEPDTSRSAQEYWQLIKLIKKGYNKDECFEKMKIYAKWSGAVPAYREHTYKKAIAETEKAILETTERNKNANVEVVTLLASKKRSEATEKLVNEFLQKNKIYTTRDDERSEVWIYEDGIYIPQGQSYIREYCREQLGGAYSTSLGTEVIAKVEVDTYIKQQDFFENKYIDQIAVENGILNVITKKLEPYNPDKIFFNKLPIIYDPEAKCPAVQRHLETVLKNKADVPVMEEIFGSFLYKDYFVEKATMLTGEGRNGKSKTIDLAKRFLGVDNCSSIPLQQFESDPYAKGDLLNKMANLAGDLDSKALKSTGAMKTLTGRDLISAQRKYLPRVKFVNFAKLIFAANKIPRTNDTTPAFWNRWVILEFPYKFLSKKELEKISPEEKENCKLADADIIKKLTTPGELSGLLNLAIEGLQRLKKQKDYSYSKSTDEVKKLWIRKSDSFAAFLMDCVEESDCGRTIKIELRRAYSDYCKAHKLKMVSDKIIKEILTETYAVSEERESVGGSRLWFWEGITLIEPKIGGGKGG